MTAPVLTITSEKSVSHALDIMEQNKLSAAEVALTWLKEYLLSLE